ncbi:hypothetical protein CSOJ01_11532 [Colletotrichum sojae]|uniref:Uncharacterized protein n=1 Tax=Colletotrichum sojae TaxID=2175907 RepID=A0A8H6IXB4_9PEZI|nr:hypothetical protein CSOJ01_11532 [Colletotrichum sojae]
MSWRLGIGLCGRVSSSALFSVVSAASRAAAAAGQSALGEGGGSPSRLCKARPVQVRYRPGTSYEEVRRYQVRNVRSACIRTAGRTLSDGSRGCGQLVVGEVETQRGCGLQGTAVDRWMLDKQRFREGAPKPLKSRPAGQANHTRGTAPHHTKAGQASPTDW